MIPVQYDRKNKTGKELEKVITLKVRLGLEKRKGKEDGFKGIPIWNALFCFIFLL